MKKTGNLYYKITDLKNIKEMYDKKVRLNTKNKVKIEKFDQYYSSNILRIKEILESKNYVPGKYNIFIIKEPKVRLIMSQDIPDKIINHLVSKYFLIDVFDKTLIEENVATRINKGTHYGLTKIKNYLKKHINENLYILKFDIKKYFFNLDHYILKQLIRKKIKDNDALKILDTIIDSTNEEYINEKIKLLKDNAIEKIKKSKSQNKNNLIKEIEQIPFCKKGKSCSIGNMSSQAFAVIYLNELDQFIKKQLKAKFYLRYNDDGILISNKKSELDKYLFEIRKIIKKYKLEFNQKTKIYNIDEGFEFLGFKYIRKNNKLIVKVRNQTKRKFKKKIKKIYKLYTLDKMNICDINQIKASYLGHLRYGNTTKLINVTFKRYEKDKYSDFGNFVKINSDGSVTIEKK